MADRHYRPSESAVSSNVASPRSSEEHLRPVPPRSPSIRVASPTMSHRHSFSDSLRGVPPSPRTSRHFSQSSLAAFQDLLNNPPKAGNADPAFAGRDWHTITVGELVDGTEVHFVDVDTGIEQATHVLISTGATVLLVRGRPEDKSAVATFDYKDLNQYLLFATGSLKPDSEHISFFQNLAKKAQVGATIPIREAKSLGTKEPFVILPHTAKLTKALEAFGSGVHRLIIVKEWTSDVIGILSQFRLVQFLWENGKSFPIIDQLYSQQIKDLGIGSQKNLVSINGDRPLREALLFLDQESVTSLAVVDNQYNVVGNISTADVKLLTKASSAPLLDNTCIHFISVILSNRGLDDGKDSVPVFYIGPYSTLAHTVAKLVATKSHRLWVTTPPSPSPSLPPTPISTTPSFATFAGSAVAGSASAATSTTHTLHTPTAMPPQVHTSTSAAVPAAALPGANISGRLTGVVSLTDILNLFARVSGLNPGDPGDRRRRESSASSSSISRLSLETDVNGGVGDGVRR